MSNILDKFGIYDLVAVLLSGICILTISILVLQFIDIIPAVMNLKVNETLLFFVLSYFTGLIFQEIGSLIQKISLNKNNRLLKASIKTSNNMHISLTDFEKNSIYSYVIEKLKLNPNEDNDSVIYNYCKYYILNNSNTVQIDKDQSISSMGRSLSLYFLMLAFAVSIISFFQFSIDKIIIIFFSLLLSLLLGYRCIRFAKMRYVKIFRTFYYMAVEKYQ